MKAEPIPVMRTPRSVDIELTARCNLRCTYCYFFDNDGRRLPRPADGGVAALLRGVRPAGGDGSVAGGRRAVHAQGPQGAAGRDRAQPHALRPALQRRADRRRHRRVHRRARGRCNYVQVSLDGSRPETHDVCRGKGSWEGAVRGIRTLQRHGVPVAVRVTIHRHNVDDLEATARFLLEELGLPSFGTNAAGYLGVCRGNAGDILLTTAAAAAGHGDAGPPDGAVPRPHPGHRRAAGRGAHVARDGGGAGRGRPGVLERRPPDRLRLPQQQDRRARRRRHRPCTMLAHMELGRINRDSLAEVWQHSQALNELRARHTIPLADFAFCAGCEYTPYCTGNCPGLAYTLTGQVDHPSPDACLRRFLAEGGR